MSRRRVIALAVVALVAAAGFWRLSRQRDPRFVGRWRIVDDAGLDSRKEIEFAADRSGIRHQRIGTQRMKMYDFSWWVDGDCCVLDQLSADAGTPGIKDNLAEFIGIITLRPKRRNEWRLHTEHLGADRVRVRQVDDENAPLGEVFEIVRIEE